MSFPGILGFAASNILGDISAGLIKPKRSMGGLVADVTVEERHNDRLTITQHPVERTAAITDHAYKEPPIVTIRCAWSSSVIGSALTNLLGGDITSLGNAFSQVSGAVTNSRPTTVYQQLLDFQNSVELLTVYTGKRKYDNMLLAEIEVITDQDSEYALQAILTFQNVILVDTQVTSTPPNSSQADPASTGNLIDRGARNLQPTPLDPSTLSIPDLQLP